MKINCFEYDPRYRYYVLECLGPDVPAVYLMDTDVVDLNDTLVAVLDNNTEAVEFAASMAWCRSHKSLFLCH
jgi:hypothetical protein